MGTEELIIQFNLGATEAAKAAALNAVMATKTDTIRSGSATDLGASELQVVSLPQGASVEAALARLNHNPMVAYAEYNRLITVQAMSDDPYYADGLQWGAAGDAAVPGNGYGSQADEVWASGSVGSSSVVVGIIDEGIDYTHPDLATNMWTNPGEIDGNGIDDDGNGYIDDIHGWDFFNDDNTIFDGTPADNVDRHGTHVAGTIGAVGGNGIGVAGINWNVQMISAKFMGPGGGMISGAVKALDYLTMLKTTYGVNVVASNNSWSATGGSVSLQAAITRAANAGILFIASAGNNSSDNDAIPSYPSKYDTAASAGYDSVITIAAIDKAGNLAGFSNYGATTVDLGAPGVSIYSTVPFGGYASMSGTSMAAPHVTGAIALYAASHPRATAAQIKNTILSAAVATPTPSLVGKTVTGGRLNLNPFAAPILQGVSSSIAYTENSTLVLAGAASITYVNFPDGVLKVEITGNGDATDRLSIKNVGTAAGQIGVSGSQLTYGGTVFATFTGGTSGINSPLVVTLGSKASQAAVQTLLRNLTYSNVSDAPSTLNRTIKFQLTDGDGGVSDIVNETITISAVNDNPVLANLTQTTAYVEGDAPVLLAVSGTVSDADSPNFASGKLIFKVSKNAQSSDRISIRNQGTGAGLIGVSGSNLTYSGTVIGTLSGTTTLTVILNSSASQPAVQALMRNVTFENISGAPSTLIRTITATVSDGDGGTSAVVTGQVTVTSINNPPVIGAFDTSITYVEDAVPLLLDGNATTTDPDLLDFATGTLTVRLVANGQSGDTLAIRNQGTGAGQIGISGSQVTYGGVLIGTFTGGTSVAIPLVIEFNSAAVQAVVQAVLRNLTFNTPSQNPSTLARTVEVQVTDGDEGTSLPVTKVINVTKVNDKPVIAGFPTAVSYTDGGSPVLVASAATITDADSTNFSGGVLTVRVAANYQSTDRMSIQNQGTGSGLIGVSGTNVTYGEVIIGTLSGTTTLTVNLNAQATVAAVKALLRNVTFSSTSLDPSTLDRTISATVSDGDGGTSVAVTTTVNVNAVNDAPVLGGAGSTVTFIEGPTAIVIASTATVTDADSADFDRGRLTVSLPTGATANDFLAIKNVGTAGGQIGVSAETVTYGGVAIGTFSGGTAGAALVVNLNQNATATSVQALMRNITFRVSGDLLSTSLRTVRFSLTDGDGGTSNDLNKQITILNL